MDDLKGINAPRPAGQFQVYHHKLGPVPRSNDRLRKVMKSELLSPQVVHLHPDQDNAQIGTYPNAGMDNAKPPLISLEIWKGVHFAIDGCRDLTNHHLMISSI